MKKIAHTHPGDVLNVPTCFLVHLKIQLYHSSQSQSCTFHQIQVRYHVQVLHWPDDQEGHLLGVVDGEGRFSFFFPQKIAQDEGGAAARDYIFFANVHKHLRGTYRIWTLAPGGSLINWPRIRKKYLRIHNIDFLTMDVLPQNLLSILYFLILDHRHPKPRNSMKPHFNVKNLLVFALWQCSWVSLHYDVIYCLPPPSSLVDIV